MSKLKVGDRVQVVFGYYGGKRGKIVVDDKSEYSCRYIVRFEPPAPQTGDDSYTWATAADLRRLVKRKRSKPAAPDRVSLRDHFAGLAMQALLSPNHPWGGNADEAIPRIAYKVADAMIAEGAK